jgi:hypothetical protein
MKKTSVALLKVSRKQVEWLQKTANEILDDQTNLVVFFLEYLENIRYIN